MKEIYCFQHDAKPEKLASHHLSLVISFIQSNKGHLNGLVCVVFIICICLIRQSICFSVSAGRSQNTKKWRYSGIIHGNPLLNGLTYNMCKHFTCCLYLSANLLVKYLHIFYVKQFIQVYMLPVKSIFRLNPFLPRLN